MRLIAVVGRGVVWLMLILVVVLLLGVWWLRSTARPQVQGAVILPIGALKGPVSITRDQWGVPHIRAGTDQEAMFALGFVHWQDRAWQMEFQRRVAAGRLAEVLGPQALPQDKFLRTWGFARAAQTDLPALSARSRGLVAAYTAGVNAAMRQGKVALEFRILGYSPEPWTELDSVSWSKLMAFDLGGNYQEEVNGAVAVKRAGLSSLRDLYPPYPAAAPTILQSDELKVNKPAPTGNTPTLPDETVRQLLEQLATARSLGFEHQPGKGSNDWVVAGKHTQSGKPLLADDPHLKLSSPMLWYLADVQGGRFKAIGATIPGLPAVVIGRNERIAWGVTNVNPDVQDLYIEPKNAPTKTRREVIRVKGQSDVVLEVLETAHGPVISAAGAEGLSQPLVALKWTALQPGDTTLDAFLGINYAQNWGEFVTALKAFVAPSQNFVYADTQGNTGYFAPGRVPLRQGWDGSLPVSGDGQHEWQGYIPFEDLPHTFNPADGLVVTANNRVVPSAYPYSLGNPGLWAEPYRAQRITELLQEKPQGLTLDDMKRVQLDTKSLVWQDLKPWLLKTSVSSEQGKRALELLKGWDGQLTAQSVPALIFEAWLMELQGMSVDELGTPLNSLGVKHQLQKDGYLCRHKATAIHSCSAVLSVTLGQALERLGGRLGTDMNAWQYGKLHQVASNHQVLGEVKALARFFNYAAPTPGGTNTVNVARPEWNTFKQTHGPSYRQIVDLSDLNRSVFIGSLGQTGGPLSAHAADQLPLWVAGQYLPMSTDQKDWGRVQELVLR